MIWETIANIPLSQLMAFMAGGLVLNFAPGQDVFFASACGIQGGPRDRPARHASFSTPATADRPRRHI